VCITCGVEEESMIKEKKWEWFFDRGDQNLRCSLCNGPDYDFEDCKKLTVFVFCFLLQKFRSKVLTPVNGKNS
jgi:hypothetical protein